MSEQNRYKILCEYKDDSESSVECVRSADTWQEAIQRTPSVWVTEGHPETFHTVMSSTPSEDGRSGVMELQLDPTAVPVESRDTDYEYYPQVAVTCKATLIEG